MSRINLAEIGPDDGRVWVDPSDAILGVGNMCFDCHEISSEFKNFVVSCPRSVFDVRFSLNLQFLIFSLSSNFACYWIEKLDTRGKSIPDDQLYFRDGRDMSNDTRVQRR